MKTVAYKIVATFEITMKNCEHIIKRQETELVNMLKAYIDAIEVIGLEGTKDEYTRDVNIKNLMLTMVGLNR